MMYSREQITRFIMKQAGALPGAITNSTFHGSYYPSLGGLGSGVSAAEKLNNSGQGALSVGGIVDDGVNATKAVANSSSRFAPQASWLSNVANGFKASPWLANTTRVAGNVSGPITAANMAFQTADVLQDPQKSSNDFIQANENAGTGRRAWEAFKNPPAAINTGVQAVNTLMDMTPGAQARANDQAYISQAETTQKREKLHNMVLSNERLKMQAERYGEPSKAGPDNRWYGMKDLPPRVHEQIDGEWASANADKAERLKTEAYTTKMQQPSVTPPAGAPLAPVDIPDTPAFGSQPAQAGVKFPAPQQQVQQPTPVKPIASTPTPVKPVANPTGNIPPPINKPLGQKTGAQLRLNARQFLSSIK